MEGALGRAEILIDVFADMRIVIFADYEWCPPIDPR
jgi:hypothetical protein